MSGSSVGQIVGGVVGGVIGFVSGGPAGAVKGFSIGYTLGGIINPPDGPTLVGPRLDDLRVTTSTYGAVQGLVYGPKNRASGNVIWSTGLIEAVKKKKSGGKGGGGTTTKTYSYSVSFALQINARPSARFSRIWMNGKLVFDAVGISLPAVDLVNGQLIDKSYGTHVVMDEVRFWPGSTTQIADPLIETYLGAGGTPAFRGRTYLTFKNLQLADFGNQMPYAIEVELVADEEITLGQVIQDLTDRSGVGIVSCANHRDQVEGYMIGASMSVSAALVPLATAYNLDIAEQGGQIRFVSRLRGMRGVIPTDEMGGRDANAGPIEPARYANLRSIGLPKQVALSFADSDFDYQNRQRDPGWGGHEQ
jgi:hypothetical protein